MYFLCSLISGTSMKCSLLPGTILRTARLHLTTTASFGRVIMRVEMAMVDNTIFGCVQH
jgi:hypothetical protein